MCIVCYIHIWQTNNKWFALLSCDCRKPFLIQIRRKTATTVLNIFRQSFWIGNKTLYPVIFYFSFVPCCASTYVYILEFGTLSTTDVRSVAFNKQVFITKLFTKGFHTIFRGFLLLFSVTDLYWNLIFRMI